MQQPPFPTSKLNKCSSPSLTWRGKSLFFLAHQLFHVHCRKWLFSPCTRLPPMIHRLFNNVQTTTTCTKEKTGKTPKWCITSANATFSTSFQVTTKEGKQWIFCFGFTFGKEESIRIAEPSTKDGWRWKWCSKPYQETTISGSVTYCQEEDRSACRKRPNNCFTGI